MRRDLTSFLRRGVAFLALSTGLTGAAQAQPFEPGYAPLEGDIYEVPGIAVADTMPKGTWQGHIGQLMADRGNAGGTGKQLYFYGIDVATSDRLQFGVNINTRVPIIYPDSYTAQNMYEMAEEVEKLVKD